MKTLLFIIFNLTSYIGFSQQDTIVNRKHFNTIVYYPYFDYKGKDTIKNNYVIGIGNTKDSAKVGVWTYYLSDGKILAQGKYRNGYKHGKWTYRTIELIWERSARAKDYIQYNSETKLPEIVDVVSTKFTSYRVVNGYTIREQRGCIRFL